jgi:NADH:ubiquinone oxidoreductase subunit 3 (subunit A)
MGQRRIYWGKWKIYEAFFPITDKDLLRIRRHGVFWIRLFFALAISFVLLILWQVGGKGEQDWPFWVFLALFLLLLLGLQFAFIKFICHITDKGIDEIRRTGKFGFFPAQIEEAPKDENKPDQRDV